MEIIKEVLSSKPFENSFETSNKNIGIYPRQETTCNNLSTNYEVLQLTAVCLAFREVCFAQG